MIQMVSFPEKPILSSFGLGNMALLHIAAINSTVVVSPAQSGGDKNAMTFSQYSTPTVD